MLAKCLPVDSIVLGITSLLDLLIVQYVNTLSLVYNMNLILVLWNTYGDCDNYGIIEGHKGAVLDLQWSRDSKYVYSASADHTLGTWDTETGERLRKHVGHEDIVNSVSTFRMGAEVLASGSDDCTIGVKYVIKFLIIRSGIHDRKLRRLCTRINTLYAR
jgi:WD40 repeat protein